ncbi:uncharacterized protein LOC117558438 isoform X2 [Gymnodraco acuticeps]|uniref:Uncharacterized protein LOC117558438 isoform X2 n=1 Tax=Gymnodraco acuticeps TaxID=8218 RepID=A0A6P8WSK2_GYMAC|nr:uncharacterized protein LOC117558438 isoform X2 [Gymnodraco acuticeps]
MGGQRPRLETIEEDSWQEDETEGSKSGEEEEDFQIQVDTKEVMVDEESEEDEDELRVQRPRRLSGSLRQASYLQNQSTNKDPEEMENSSDLDRSTQALDLCDEATTQQPKRFLNQKWSMSKLLRIEVSKVKWPKHTPPKQSVQMKRTRKRVKKVSKAQGFPKWLVDLMINIEEATTHQLVVE